MPIFLFLLYTLQLNAAETKLNPTVYCTPEFSAADECLSKEYKSLVDHSGKKLLKLCKNDFDNCELQGSCIYTTESGERKLYNFIESKADTQKKTVTNSKGKRITKEVPIGGKINRYSESTLDDCPYGYGVEKICLDPFFTLAADLDIKGKDGKPIHKPGDVIFVPSMVGVAVGNKVHDGYFTIRDRGGAINGAHRFDFFSGSNCGIGNSNPLAAKGFGHKKNEIPYTKIKDPSTVAQIRGRRLYPSVPPVVYAFKNDDGTIGIKTLGGTR